MLPLRRISQKWYSAQSTTYRFKPERDPMAHMSEEEKDRIRKHVMSENARVGKATGKFMVGGAILLAGTFAYCYRLFQKSPEEPFDDAKVEDYLDRLEKSEKK